MIHNLAYILDEQGFELTRSWIEEETLIIQVINNCYRSECIVRSRLEHILAATTPANFKCVVVIIESFGLPCHEYIYPRELLLKHFEKRISPFEFELLTPRREYGGISDKSELIFYHRLDPWEWKIAPRVETFFGSAKGKVKYDMGLKANVEGFLPNDIFYETQISYTMFSDITDVTDFDIFSPSQLPNVLTDYVNYRKARIFSTDKIYIQKNWNLRRGWFARAALGYFQVNYAGIEGEILYYPANQYFAVGIEGAALRKRRYTGLWFQSKLRHFEGTTPVYEPYTLLSQYFLDLYFDIPEFSLAAKLSAGGFLAGDHGFRIEVTRYFESGLRLTGWMTFTNAKDTIHNENFYNRGIALELPLDIFFRCSSRRVWNYGLAAWLRDAGATIFTAKPLFTTINEERRGY